MRNRPNGKPAKVRRTAGCKLARKKAQREGLIPAPKKKLLDAKGQEQRPGMRAHARQPRF